MAKKKTAIKKASAKKQVSPKKANVKKSAPKKASKTKTEQKKKSATKKKKEDLMCFLTTACVQHYGLADDCVQLQTLRTYRDAYLQQRESGKVLVQEYYRVSPKIVEEIERAGQQTRDYSFIYTRVNKAVKEIQEKSYEAAQATYTRMVKTLATRYDLKLQCDKGA